VLSVSIFYFFVDNSIVITSEEGDLNLVSLHKGDQAISLKYKALDYFLPHYSYLKKKKKGPYFHLALFVILLNFLVLDSVSFRLPL
jgi:hypothetical protein